jgi:hypothetical protein
MDSISEIEEVAGGRRRISKCMLRTGTAVLRTVRDGMQRSASLDKRAKAMRPADPSGTLDEQTERMTLINRALRNPSFSRLDTLGD